MTANAKGPIDGNDGALKKALNHKANPSTDPLDGQKTALLGLCLIAQMHRLQTLGNAAGRSLPPSFNPRAGYLVLVADDPDTEVDESRGPSAFPALLTAQLLKDAQIFIFSGEPTPEASAAAAAFITGGPTRRNVLILTRPKHHHAWNEAAVRRGGVVRIHCTEDGLVPGVPEVA